MKKNDRHRVRSLVTPHRDPFADDMQVILKQMKREANREWAMKPLAINLTQTLQALIIDCLREPCLQCGGKPDSVFLWRVPEELRKAGQQIVLYSLCGECKLDITTRGKVSDRIAAELKDENARMGE